MLVVGDVGDNGEADWMEARLEQNFETICEPSGALSKCPRFQAKAVCWHIRPVCAAGMWFECFFEFWKLVAYGAKVALGPSD